MTTHLCASCTPHSLRDDYVSIPSQAPRLERQDAQTGQSPYVCNSSASSQPPSGPTPLAALKAALTAVPGSTAMIEHHKGRKRQRYVGKIYDPVAARPRPALMSPAQTQITATLRYDTVNWMVISATVPVYASEYITIAKLDASSKYLTLFDQYRIEEVEVWLEPDDPRDTGSSSPLATGVDIDDANVPTTFDQVADKQGSLVSSGLAARYHRWVPHVAVAVYSGAFTSFANSPPMWIDVGSPNVQHYGLKAASTALRAQSMNLSVRAKVSFRGASI